MLNSNVREAFDGSVTCAPHNFPDEPSVNGSKQKLAFLSPLTGTIDMIQKPLGLGPRKIRIQTQSSLLFYGL